MLSLDQRISISPDVVYRKLGVEGVILHLETGIYFGLNEAGNRIWELAQEHDLRTTCARLAEEYDAPPEVIQRDVLALVARLADKQLIVVAQ